MGKVSPSPWTTTELALLRELSVDGWSAVTLHQNNFFSRHPFASIKGMMQKLQLGDDRHRQRIAKARRLKPCEKAELLSFLSGQGKLLPSYDVARKFQISQRMVTYYRQKVLRFRLANDACYSSKRYKASHIRRVPKRAASIKRYYAERFWQKRLAKMQRMFTEELEKGLVVELRSCRKCQVEWPKSVRYFYQENHRVTKQPFLTFRCRACAKKKNNLP
jgi:DNA-binding CsgD family transcriptional regulator